jgi:ketosteroid isomerase-like protein
LRAIHDFQFEGIVTREHDARDDGGSGRESKFGGVWTVRKGFLLSICGIGLLGLSACMPNRSMSQEELVRRTQELVNAVAPGDQAPWKKYFADDCMFFDERGRNMDKKTLVGEITPLPEGSSGTIAVGKVQSHIEGNVAILSYDLNETEIIFGQVEKARYHETDTWMRRNGEWKIVAGQVLRYYEDPAAGTVDARELKDYVGRYEIAPGKTLTISQEGQQLFLQRQDKPKVVLIPEVSPIFFRKGVEGRTLFRRAANGKVQALIDRRNNEDVVWKKVPSQPEK